MSRIINIGDVSVAPGEKKCGRLQFGSRPDGAPIFIPLMIVNGAGQGPVFNVSGGCHGDEYEGCEAIRRWWRALDPKDLRGVFLGVPVINVVAFEAGNRLSWIDKANLNRVYPGSPTGFLTERLAHVYLNQVVYKADLVLDIHGGGNIQTMADVAIWRDSPGEPEVIQGCLKLARATGFKYIWKGSAGHSGTVTIEAMKKGIPAVTVEAGGDGRCREEVIQACEKIVGNIMKSYNMIDGEPDLPAETIMAQGLFIHAESGGFYTQAVEVHERVKAGQTLGTISDLFGQVIETIKAPYDGIVYSKRTFPVVHSGDWTLVVAKVVDE